MEIKLEAKAENYRKEQRKIEYPLVISRKLQAQSLSDMTESLCFVGILVSTKNGEVEREIIISVTGKK